MAKILKHDTYVNELKQKILSDYDSISTHVPFSMSQKSTGEVDIIATKGSRVDLFEVKCSYKYTKAKKQLSRARKHIGSKGNSYFYCGNMGLLLLVN